MNTSRRSLWSRSVRAFLLWGYGWNRRIEKRDACYRVEWQDPTTGLWYREDTALRLMKAYCMALYGKPPTRSTAKYRAYF